MYYYVRGKDVRLWTPFLWPRISGEVLVFCLIFTLTTSSVAKGAGEGAIASPIGLKSMQNTPFLALLSPIYALKAKIATPPLVLVLRIGQEPGVISTKKTGLQSGWRPFSFFFFGDHLHLDGETDSIWVKTDQNLGQDPLMLFPASKSAPPYSKLLATCLLTPLMISTACERLLQWSMVLSTSDISIITFVVTRLVIGQKLIEIGLRWQEEAAKDLMIIERSRQPTILF